MLVNKSAKSLFLLVLMLCSSLPAFAQIKVACVGNSITYGSGIKNRTAYSYPAQLQLILGNEWEVKNFGVSGRTMLKKGNQPLWKEKAFSDALAYQPDVVIIKLGTNDSKDFNWKYKDEFSVDYQAMIDTFTQVSNPMIFVCRPVPAFGNQWNIDSLVIVDEVIPQIEAVAQSNDLQVIDLFNPFQNHKALFPDLIHPNGHGAALMAGIISKYLLKSYTQILENKINNHHKKN
ncbi:MAG: GDSL-type esterase/lipase family protein [Bacteroidota bacterium]